MLFSLRLHPFTSLTRRGDDAAAGLRRTDGKGKGLCDGIATRDHCVEGLRRALDGDAAGRLQSSDERRRVSRADVLHRKIDRRRFARIKSGCRAAFRSNG